jgi:hypothetical protein
MHGLIRPQWQLMHFEATKASSSCMCEQWCFIALNGARAVLKTAKASGKVVARVKVGAWSHLMAAIAFSKRLEHRSRTTGRVYSTLMKNSKYQSVQEDGQSIKNLLQRNMYSYQKKDKVLWCKIGSGNYIVICAECLAKESRSCNYK